jgi:hypothetical protein
MSEATRALSEKPVPAKTVDLSVEIVQTIAKAPGDRVTCRHISGDHYRCNWWASQGTIGYDNPGMYGLTVTTHRVRKSQFLRVTKTEGALRIESTSSSSSSSSSQR